MRKLSCQHRAMNLPGEQLICKGRVVKKYVEAGENLVDCDVCVENQDGLLAAPGKTTVSLPSKGKN